MNYLVSMAIVLLALICFLRVLAPLRRGAWPSERQGAPR